MDNHIREIIKIQRASMLLLHKTSIRFIDYMIMGLLITGANTYDDFTFRGIMSTFKHFIDIKKNIDFLDNPLPNWLSLFIYGIEASLIEYAKSIDLYNNEFIDILNELKTFLPNRDAITRWDLSNNERATIIRKLDDGISDIFTQIADILMNSIAS